MTKEFYVSDELLHAYKLAKTTIEQTVYVSEALQNDASLQAKYMEMLREDELADKVGQIIPMESMAAASEDNLCDILCEKYILRNLGKNDNAKALLASEDDNKWLKKDGTPLFNMGRILEANGMSVTRRYDCSFKDITGALAKHIRLIAVVDYGLLKSDTPSGLFHAVVCVSANDYLIRIYDPAGDDVTDYDVDVFLEAWSESRYYLVMATTDTLEYDPCPVFLDDVELDEDLLDLTEAIAENAHDVWGLARKNEGWRYGKENCLKDKTNPDMVPYCDLPESEKQYDRDMAIMTLKLAKKLGFRVSRYSKNKCKNCGSSISIDMMYCPQCGNKLEWKDFFDK